MSGLGPHLSKNISNIVGSSLGAAVSKRSLCIFDCTLPAVLRKCGSSLKPDDILKIAKQLENMRVDVIEAGCPAASANELEIVRQVASAVQNPVVCAVASTVEDDIRQAGNAIKLAKRKRIRIVVATSSSLMKQKLKMTCDEVIEAIASAVKVAGDYTSDVELNAEDVFQSNFDFLCRVFETAISAGANTVGLCDVCGCRMPDQWSSLLSNLITEVPGSDKVSWSTRCRNDLGLALANSLCAIESGAKQVVCAVNGLGDQVGITSLKQVVTAVDLLSDRFNCTITVDASQLVSASRLVAELTGIPSTAEESIVEANPFAHGVLNTQRTTGSKKSALGATSPEDVVGDNEQSQKTLSGPSYSKTRPDETDKLLGSESAKVGATSGWPYNGELGDVMKPEAAVSSEKVASNERHKTFLTTKPTVPARVTLKNNLSVEPSPRAAAPPATVIPSEVLSRNERAPAIPTRSSLLSPSGIQQTLETVSGDSINVPPPVPVRGRLTPAVTQSSSIPPNALDPLRPSTRPTIPPRKL